MNRKLLAGLLGLGVLFGFASGFRSLHHDGRYFRHGHGWRHSAFEDHVAEVCTRAAEKVVRERPPQGAASSP
jgi:hypothetical protein